MIVRIFKYWDNLNILRQTPGCRGEWRGVKFIVDKPGPADYVIVHCHAKQPVPVWCSPENIWLVMGEPPNEHYKAWHIAPPWMGRVYTSDESLPQRSSKMQRYLLSYPCIPWHVDKDYDFLTTCPIPDKTLDLVWITSNRADTAGHTQRMETLERLKQLPELHLFGRGLHPISDKWDALAPARYAIAYENFSNAYYWTEKVMDCFLAWTMPLYYGCNELEQFFPPEAFVRIDPQWPDLEERVREIIHSDRRERNMDAIEEARRRVLNDYNFFEFVVGQIEAQQKEQASALAAPRAKRVVWVRDHTQTPAQTMQQELQQRVAVARIRAGGLRRHLSNRFS